MLDSKSATMIVTLCKDDFVDAVFLPMPVQDLKNLKICDGYPAEDCQIIEINCPGLPEKYDRQLLKKEMSLVKLNDKACELMQMSGKELRKLKAGILFQKEYIKSAVKDFNQWQEHAVIRMDLSDGDIWTDIFPDDNDFKVYHSDSIITIYSKDNFRGRDVKISVSELSKLVEHVIQNDITSSIYNLDYERIINGM